MRSRIVRGKQQVVIRLEKDLVKRIDHIAVEWDVFRGEAIERLLGIAVEQSTLHFGSEKRTSGSEA